jgi:hypothetical protein
LVVQPGQDWDSDNDTGPLDHPCQTPSACARDCNTLHTKQELAAGAAAQSKTRWRAPQGDAELMTEKQVLRLKPAPRLEQIGDIPTECRIASIGPDDAMILPHDANPGRMQFWKRTGVL